MRRYKTQLIETMYVNMRQTRLREMMALLIISQQSSRRVGKQNIAYKATSEPMLIKDNRRMSTAVNTTALRGTSNEGSTFAIQRENGKPSSRANLDRCQH